MLTMEMLIKVSKEKTTRLQTHTRIKRERERENTRTLGRSCDGGWWCCWRETWSTIFEVLSSIKYSVIAPFQNFERKNRDKHRLSAVAS